MVTSGLVAGFVGSAGMAYATYTVVADVAHMTASSGHLDAVQVGAARLSAELYPGGSSPVIVTLSNPNHAAVRIIGVTADPIIARTTGCAATNIAFDAIGNLGVPVAGDARRIDVPLGSVVRMLTNAPLACQRAEFTIPVRVTVELPPA